MRDNPPQPGSARHTPRPTPLARGPRAGGGRRTESPSSEYPLIRLSVRCSPSRRAPELFRASPVAETADQFSFAVLLWECFTGLLPWRHLSSPMQARGRASPPHSHDKQQTDKRSRRSASRVPPLKKVPKRRARSPHHDHDQVIFAVAVQRERLALPETCPSGLCALIKACWAERPSERPPFSEASRPSAAMDQPAQTCAPRPRQRPSSCHRRLRGDHRAPPLGDAAAAVEAALSPRPHDANHRPGSAHELSIRPAPGGAQNAADAVRAGRVGDAAFAGRCAGRLLPHRVSSSTRSLRAFVRTVGRHRSDCE